MFARSVSVMSVKSVFLAGMSPFFWWTANFNKEPWWRNPTAGLSPRNNVVTVNPAANQLLIPVTNPTYYNPIYTRTYMYIYIYTYIYIYICIILWRSILPMSPQTCFHDPYPFWEPQPCIYIYTYLHMYSHPGRNRICMFQYDSHFPVMFLIVHILSGWLYIYIIYIAYIHIYYTYYLCIYIYIHICI